jgi:hypothetical protein
MLRQLLGHWQWQLLRQLVQQAGQHPDPQPDYRVRGLPDEGPSPLSLSPSVPLSPMDGQREGGLQTFTTAVGRARPLKGRSPAVPAAPASGNSAGRNFAWGRCCSFRERRFSRVRTFANLPSLEAGRARCRPGRRSDRTAGNTVSAHGLAASAFWLVRARKCNLNCNLEWSRLRS